MRTPHRAPATATATSTVTSTRPAAAAGRGRRAALAVALAAVSLAGCTASPSGVADPAPTSAPAGATEGAPTPTPTPTQPTGAAAAPGTEDPGAGTDAAADGPEAGAEPAFLAADQPATADPSADTALNGTSVRTGVHEGFDRVVLDLAGTGSPGWRVQYVDEPTYQAVGGPVPLDGAAALAVYVTGIDWTDPAAPPFEGPRSLAPGGVVVRDVEYGSAFEGEQELFLGVDARAPFRVFALTDPARLVIDVQHP